MPKENNPPAPVALGDPFRFRPSGFTGESFGGPRSGKVTGKVIYVHAAHRVFTVEYEANGRRLRESFKY